MGLVSRMTWPQAASWGPEDDRWYYPGGSFYGGITPTQAGVGVDSDSAMRLITVQNCVRMRSSTLARLPCHIMETKGRNKNKATDFYLYDKLLYQPNSWMTAPEFWGMVEAYVSLRGNFYAYKLGIEGRPLLGLIPIQADAVREVVQEADYSLAYNVLVGGRRTASEHGDGGISGGTVVSIPGSKIMHLRGLTLNGYMGINPIEYAREAVGKGIASEQHLARWFSRGLHPGAIIKHPLPLSGPAFKNRRDQLKDRYEGLGKSHEFMLLDEAMEISFPDIKLVDAQFLEQMKLTEAQICGMFRVPLMLVNGGDKAPTYASAEQFMLFYQMFSIDVAIYESGIRRDLLTPEERKRYYAKFELRALQRGSFKEQIEGFGTGIDKEIYNPNEVREWLEMNPYDGGDEYRTRTSTTKDTGKPTPATAQGGATIRPMARKKDKVDWERLYREGDAHWADDMQPSKFAQDFAEKLVDGGKKSILEIGCGNGRDSILFALAGLSVTAIDLVPEAVEIAKENAQKAGVTIDFYVGNAESLEFPDDAFGAVFTLSVLHATNMSKSLPEVHRVMQDGSLAFVYVYSNVEKIDGTETEFISVDEYIDLVKKTGFEIADIYTLPEEEFDEAGEKHLLIISELKK